MVRRSVSALQSAAAGFDLRFDLFVSPASLPSRLHHLRGLCTPAGVTCRKRWRAADLRATMFALSAPKLENACLIAEQFCFEALRPPPRPSRHAGRRHGRTTPKRWWFTTYRDAMRSSTRPGDRVSHGPASPPVHQHPSKVSPGAIEFQLRTPTTRSTRTTHVSTNPARSKSCAPLRMRSLPCDRCCEIRAMRSALGLSHAISRYPNRPGNALRRSCIPRPLRLCAVTGYKLL